MAAVAAACSVFGRTRLDRRLTKAFRFRGRSPSASLAACFVFGGTGLASSLTKEFRFRGRSPTADVSVKRRAGDLGLNLALAVGCPNFFPLKYAIAAAEAFTRLDSQVEQQSPRSRTMSSATLPRGSTCMTLRLSS